MEEPASSEADYESLAPTYPVWVHLSAGALAGMAEHCATFPIDRLSHLKETPLYSALSVSKLDNSPFTNAPI